MELDHNSFLQTRLGFSPQTGIYTNGTQKTTETVSITTFEKILSKVQFNIGSIVYGSKKKIINSFGLDVAPGHKVL